jgi:protein LTV1
MGKRKFNKNGKDVVHFRLVHRTGKEEEGASKHVLEPYVPTNVAKKFGPEPDIPEDLERELGPEVFGGDPEEEEYDDESVVGSEALDGDCYFPKDGYDYDQHLKYCGTADVVLVPSDLQKERQKEGGYPSTQEPEVSQASSSTLKVPSSRSAVQDEVSQDVLEALDALDATDEFEELTDDWMETIVHSAGVSNAELLWNEKEERNFRAKGGQEEFMPELLLDDLFDDDEEEDGVGPRADTSVKADAEFLDMMKEYDDDEIGELSEPETDEGEEREKVLEACEQVAGQYIDAKEEEQKRMEMYCEYGRSEDAQQYFEELEKERGVDEVPMPFEKTRALAEKFLAADSDAETSDGENAESYLGHSHQTEKEEWDCESILSTYSNTSNRPGRIVRPKIAKPKKKAIEPVVEENEDEEDSDDSADARAVALLDAPTERPKNETVEEKKARKAAVKALRQECRKLKKESKVTYKQEASKLSKTSIGTSDLRTQVRSIKM